jgi:hypothetical protein
VTDFIVGNEPNVNRFWQPQYLNGRDAAPIDYEHTLAASYDALKTVRPDAVVWGPAISSRGNDNPLATSNPSHSPVRFIEAMGAAYAASGRTEPIFDEFDMHPYPSVQDTSSFAKPFLWPQVGAANLDRVKQALWDAFHDTAQPLPAEYGGGRTASAGLPIDLDEAGEQTTVTGHPDYTRAPENVIPIDETTQAARYVELARIGACDPDVKSILWFPLIDDGGLSDGFQSGELYADLTRKLSYSALKDQIATSGGRCDAPVPGVPRGWVHTTRVSGAAIVKQPSNRPAGAGVTAVFTAAEDVSYTATVVDAATGRRQATGIRRLLTTTGTLRAYRKPPLRFAGPIPAGRYRIRLVLTAAMNPERSTALTTLPFTVAAKK